MSVACVLVVLNVSTGCDLVGSGTDAPRSLRTSDPTPSATRTGLDTTTPMSATEQRRYLAVIDEFRERARAGDCDGAWQLGGASLHESYPIQQRFCDEVLRPARSIDLTDASYVVVGRDGVVRVLLGNRRGTTSSFGMISLVREAGRPVLRSVDITPPS